jgi:hypothetical protein
MISATQSAPEVATLKLENRKSSESTRLTEFLRTAWQALLAEILCRSAGEIS